MEMNKYQEALNSIDEKTTETIDYCLYNGKEERSHHYRFNGSVYELPERYGRVAKKTPE